MLTRVCARTGREAELADLHRIPGFVVRNGPDLAVDSTTVGLLGEALGAPEARWLEVASEELAGGGDAVGALDLALRSGSVARVRAVLAESVLLLIGGSIVASLLVPPRAEPERESERTS